MEDLYKIDLSDILSVDIKDPNGMHMVYTKMDSLKYQQSHYHDDECVCPKCGEFLYTDEDDERHLDCEYEMSGLKHTLDNIMDQFEEGSVIRFNEGTEDEIFLVKE